MKPTIPSILSLSTAACLTLALPAVGGEVEQYEAYRQVVADSAAMVYDAEAQALAAKHGLQILNVTWEDTGRYDNSSVGPNISDMTIQVQEMDPRTEEFDLTCMPVIRFPNFEDVTADLAMEDFHLLVGNEDGDELRKVSLDQLLGDLPAYLHEPSSWAGDENSLLAERDTHVLVSAQAAFLPIPKEGIAEFNPVLFNYRSYAGDPAVMTILATREGTSMTVIDNQRDGFDSGGTWGQRLFFNKDGERAVFTGQRLSDFKAEQDGTGGKKGEPSASAAGEEGLNMVLLIQVPLKQKNPMTFDEYDYYEEDEGEVMAAAPMERASDVEAAVIGHGRVEGPFTEIDDLEIERDPAFPVRVTVQFYKATSNGVVSAQDMTDIAKQIQRVYDQADYVGSLVVDGETGRPTEYDGDKNPPADWWLRFWERHYGNTGMTPEETMEMLDELLGPDWRELSRNELRIRSRRAQR
jgi:hypothetical protein